MPLVSVGSHTSLNNKKLLQITRSQLEKKTYYEKNYVDRVKTLELLRVLKSK